MSARRVRIAFLGLIALILLGAGVALATGEVTDKVRSGGDVSVDAGEVVPTDLYVFAQDVVIDGTIEGDLVVAAGAVTINGTVEGDLVAGTGRLFLNGEVIGDVRAGAGEITVTGSIGEDLLLGSGTATITTTGEIGEDFIFGSGDVTVDGAVAGSVLGSASTYTRNGTVGGSEQVTLTEGGSPPGIPTPPIETDPVRIAGDALRQFVSVVFIGALGLVLVPGAVRASEGALRRRPLAALGLGIGVLVGYIIQFIAVILFMILLALAFGSVTLDSLAGFSVWLGILDLLFTSFALVLSMAFVVDVIVGLTLARLVAREWAQNRWQEFVLMVGGAFVVVAITSLPVIGGFAKLAAVLLGLGAMAVAFGEWWQRRNPPAPVTFPAAPAPLPADPPADPSAA